MMVSMDGIYISSIEYYTGYYSSNKKHEKGVNLDRNENTIYIGNYAIDKRNGQGLLINNVDILDSKISHRLEMEECLKDIVKEGLSLFSIDGADIIYGEWKDDIVNGKGFIRYPDNTFYIGEISNKQRSGNGAYLKQNIITEGCFCSNDFVKGVIVEMPYNIIEFATAFVTHSCDTLPIIKGKISYSNSNIYEGEIKGTLKHGIGILHLSTDEVCKGSWHNNEINGEGEILLSDGTTFKRQFVNGKKHGRGVLKSCSGITYDGEWKDDRCDGIGTLILRNSDIYEGEVRDYLAYSSGTFRTIDHQVIKRSWKLVVQ